MHQGGAPTEPDGQTRRDFIRRLSVVGAGGAAPGALAACGGSTSSSATASTSGGTPKKGGILRAAFSGGSSTDTIDGDNVINNLDFARTYQLYDSLVRYDEHGQIVNSL